MIDRSGYGNRYNISEVSGRDPKGHSGKTASQPGQKVQTIVFGDRIELIPVQPMKKMRGFLKGIDTAVLRDDDRL